MSVIYSSHLYSRLYETLASVKMCASRCTNEEVGALAELLDELVAHVARRVRAVDEREHAALAARLD